MLLPRGVLTAHLPPIPTQAREGVPLSTQRQHQGRREYLQERREVKRNYDNMKTNNRVTKFIIFIPLNPCSFEMGIIVNITVRLKSTTIIQTNETICLERSFALQQINIDLDFSFFYQRECTFFKNRSRLQSSLSSEPPVDRKLHQKTPIPK